MLKKLRNRILSCALAIVSVLGLLPMTTFAAENYNGGWAMSGANQAVYNNASGSSQIGSIYTFEGMTVLSQSGNTAYVEYSTPNGAKRGYLINPNYYQESIGDTCVARVNAGSSTYGAPNAVGVLNIGSVSAGEYVAVLAKEGNWVYVEYNTSGGRKRGYMSYSSLTCYNRPGYFPDFYQTTGSPYTFSAGSATVYGGPSEQYAPIGSIGNETVTRHTYFQYGADTFFYISYNASGYTKYGYILVRDF